MDYTTITGNLMHKHILHVIVLSTLYSINALAGNTVNISFSGKVASPSCTISTDSVDQTVDLSDTALSDITVNNNTGVTIPVPFNINIEKCAGVSNAVVTFTGEPLTGENGTIGIVGTAKGASIVLYDADGSRLNTGTASKSQNLTAGTNNSLHFFAGLVGQGPMSTPQAGNFSATARFSIDYF